VTDNLRDRIAALLELLRPVTPTEAADAVIRELQIEAEDGECGYCHAMLPGCRYSTWKADYG
jgi:hypothetical protein